MRRILLSKLRALGDTVLLSATLEECRRLLPNDQIHLLVPKSWSALYENDPRVYKLWSFDTGLRGIKKFTSFISLASELRNYDFDISLACHANATSSWLGFLSGAQKRAHHNHNFLEEDKFGNLEIPDKKILKPFIQRDLAVLQALEVSVNVNASTQLYLSAKQKNWASGYFKDLALKGPVLGLGLGASRATKIWPIQNFSKLSHEWHSKTGGSVLCFLSPAEAALGVEWKSSLPDDCFRLISDLSLSQMMAVMPHLDLFLGNDSGPRHLAAAMGVKTLTLYGPQDPYECHPYNSAEHPYFFIEGLSCRKNTDLEGKHPWCGIAICDIEKHKCMVEISVTTVVERTLELLQSRK